MDVKSGDRIKAMLLKTLKEYKTAIRILNFKGPRAEESNLYKESNIYTLKQIKTIENYRFVYDQIKKSLPKNFNNYFTVTKNQHQYGSNSITLKAIKQWNKVRDSFNIDQMILKSLVPDFLG